MAKKDKYQDDGHTIYNMDVEGMPHRRRHNNNNISISKEERRALMKAGFVHYLPVALCVIVSFCLAMLVIYLWLQ